MERQLALIESPSGWRLSETTREIGRRGIASARAALASAVPLDLAAEQTEDRSAA